MPKPPDHKPNLVDDTLKDQVPPGRIPVRIRIGIAISVTVLAEKALTGLGFIIVV